jgi:transcriptional regulator with XRE-family HTH domain
MRSPKNTDLMTAFAVELKSLRNASEITQRELALSSGVSRASIARIELAENQPTISVLFDLSKGLGVPAEVLIAGTRQRFEKNKEIQSFISPKELRLLAARRAENTKTEVCQNMG